MSTRSPARILAGLFAFLGKREMAQPDRTSEIRELLSRRILVLDGAMGTQIQTYGLDEAAFRGDRFANHTRDL